MNEITQDSKLHRAILKSKKLKRPNHWNMQSGRFPHLPRFTKLQNFLLESFYTISDMHNPSAYRFIYIYLDRLRDTKVEEVLNIVLKKLNVISTWVIAFTMQ